MIYLTVIRHDITFAVGVLSKFMHHFREIHWIAALMILAYVKSSFEKGLMYKKYEHVHIFGILTQANADDKGDRKSTVGYYTFIGGNLVT